MVGPIGGVGAAVPVPEPTAPRAERGHFREAMAAARGAREGPGEPSFVTGVLRGVAEGQREMDRIIRLARSGRSFSPAELLGFQARIYRLSQELDLASKLVEKATSGVKQAMSTQV